MAAATLVRKRINYEGSRKQMLATVNLAASDDTFNTGLHLIEYWNGTSTAAGNGIGGIVSGGTITFKTGGAETGLLVEAIGF